MSLESELHDLRLALESADVSSLPADEEYRLRHVANKLTALLDLCPRKSAAAIAAAGAGGVSGAAAAAAASDEPESLLSIALQYGVRVSDLRRHNAHLKHYEDREPLPRNTPVKIKASSRRPGTGGSGSRRGGSAQAAAAPVPQGVAAGGALVADAPNRYGAVPRATGGGSGYGRFGALAQPPVGAPLGSDGARVAYDTIRSIAREHNVAVHALLESNSLLRKFELDEPLPQDLEIVLPANAEPAQRTYVMTFAGETLRVIADSVARCDVEQLFALNPQLGPIGPDARLPEGTRIALPPR